MPDLFIAPNGNNPDPVDSDAGQASSLHKRMPVTSPNTNSTAANTISSTITTATPQDPPKKLTTPAKQEPKNNTPLFTSFWQNPSGIYFDTQEIDENILLFLRRHPITNTGWIIGVIIFALIPPAVFYISNFFHKEIILSNNPNFNFAIIIFYYLIVATIAFMYFINWYYNISLITQKRVVSIILSNIVVKKIAETKLSLVQDVNYQQNGAIRSIFDYGDVLIQTAGTLDNFFISSVPQPENVVHIVENLIGEDLT